MDDAGANVLRAVLIGVPADIPALAGWECLELPAWPDAAPSGGEPVLTVVSQQKISPADGWGVFARRLAGRRDAGPVVLVRDTVEPGDLVLLFRAGLYDSITADADEAQWRTVLDRAAERLVELGAGRGIEDDHALTQRLLRDSQRRLRDETAAETEALLQAQADLEQANQRLADHMAQVSLLYQFGRELSQAPNWDDTLREILANLAEFIGAVGGALVLRSASGGVYAPRQTYRWQEQSWDKVLLRITTQIDAGVASSLLAPGIFQVGRDDGGGRITALPLEHQGVRLGMLLLLFADAEERRARTDTHLSFLQMVQVVVSEEVAGAQMLDRLRDIGAFNTRVLETVSSAIWVCDGDGRSLFVNRAAREILGLDAAASPDDPAAQVPVGRGRMLERPLTGGADMDDLPEIFLDGLLALDGAGGEPFATLSRSDGPVMIEGHITDREGHAIPVRIQTRTMAGRGRDETWLLVILEDQRETRRADAARRRAEKAESLVAMSATLAHEIRNPLMGLSAQAELLADSLPEDDSRRDRIDLITGEVERINRTITDMLQFVRPCEPAREPFDPRRLVRDCLELARPRADGRDVALTFEDSGTLLLDADPVQIKQVLLNLVLNAVDAAPDGGGVTVRLQDAPSVEVRDLGRGTSRRVPGVMLCVEDDGPGFGATDPERIFEPFFTTKTTGTGLGLAYSRKVVDAHGGDIRAERLASCTRMTVVLPRQAEAGDTLAGEAS
jgi:signal transduction histidine kinase